MAEKTKQNNNNNKLKQQQKKKLKGITFVEAVILQSMSRYITAPEKSNYWSCSDDVIIILYSSFCAKQNSARARSQ